MVNPQREEKEQIVDGVTYQYSTDWIHALESEEHWRLYWRQQHLMQGLVQAGDHVLEIGVGSGFTANYLRTKGVRVTTLDIDQDKSPDIVANVVTYQFPDRYDCVLAFEVFEHIPFEEFEKILAKVHSACRRCLFFSVPRNRKSILALTAKLPKLRPFGFQWKVRRKALIESHHFWEVDYQGTTIPRVEQTLQKAGFGVPRREEAFDRLFFACEKTSASRQEVEQP